MLSERWISSSNSLFTTGNVTQNFSIKLCPNMDSNLLDSQVYEQQNKLVINMYNMFIRILNTDIKLLSTWQLQLRHCRLFTPSIWYYIQHKSPLHLELLYNIITASHAGARGMIPEAGACRKISSIREQTELRTAQKIFPFWGWLENFLGLVFWGWNTMFWGKIGG